MTIYGTKFLAVMIIWLFLTSRVYHRLFHFFIESHHVFFADLYVVRDLLLTTQGMRPNTLSHLIGIVVHMANCKILVSGGEL